MSGIEREPGRRREPEEHRDDAARQPPAHTPCLGRSGTEGNEDQNRHHAQHDRPAQHGPRSQAVQPKERCGATVQRSRDHDRRRPGEEQSEQQQGGGDDGVRGVQCGPGVRQVMHGMQSPTEDRQVA